LNHKIIEARMDHADKADAAKAAKGYLDKLTTELSGYITDDEQGQRTLSFNPDAQPPETPFSESWRTVPLAEVLLTAPGLKQLAEAGIKTMGDMADFTANHSDFDDPLVGITGIGKAKAEKIQNDLDAFWAAHPEYTQIAHLANIPVRFIEQ
jgi:hypothetical protein